MEADEEGTVIWSWLTWQSIPGGADWELGIEVSEGMKI